MLITEETRESIVNLLGGLGVIAIILSIFLDTIEFGLAIVIAVFLWLLSDVIKTWIKIDKINDRNIFQNGKAFSKLLGLLGVWVIVFAIFMDEITFTLAIVIAISLWIFSGVASDFFGIGKTRGPKRRYARSTPAGNPGAIEYGSPSPDNFDEGPAKVSCQNCGNSLIKGDIFCSVCGEKTN